MLKNLISYFMLPFPVVLLLLGVGLSLLWFTARQKAGKILISVGLLFLLIFSWPVSNDVLTGPLHRALPLVTSAETAGVRWVVVLGSGYSTTAGVPATGRLSGHCLARLVEGIRLVRALPGSRLLVSGGMAYGGVVQADVMADAAVSLGIPRADIVLESKSDDTQDEARFVREIVGDDRIILVTSTSHMRRSVALFEKQGVKVIPAPAGFWASHTSLLPQSGFLSSADGAMHEYLGMLWSRLRGTI